MPCGMLYERTLSVKRIFISKNIIFCLYFPGEKSTNNVILISISKQLTLERTSNQAYSEADSSGVIAVREDPGNYNLLIFPPHFQTLWLHLTAEAINGGFRMFVATVNVSVFPGNICKGNK